MDNKLDWHLGCNFRLSDFSLGIQQYMENVTYHDCDWCLLYNRCLRLFFLRWLLLLERRERPKRQCFQIVKSWIGLREGDSILL